MYLVTLNPDLLEVNARIAATPRRRALTATDPALGGTLYNGHNQVTAQVAPGTSGTITVTFQITVLSIGAATFGTYRTELANLLSAGTEPRIARAAGIPPADPPSRMANYALQLFSDVVFGGQEVAEQSRAFSPTPACMRVLAATRLLAVTQLSFSGTLTASSASPATQQAAAYVPITAIEFSDGLTIPFAGYSDNVLVDVGGLQALDVV